MSRMRGRAGNHQALPVLVGGPESGVLPKSDPLPCIKVTYGDEAAALVVARKNGHTPYRCPVCKRWHLTSRRSERRWRSKS